MQNEKIQVLAIAPYEGMKTTIERIAKNRPDIVLDAYVGDLAAGKDVVLRSMEKPYDVIISRGGTAQLIETITELPVVEISLSVYDILRSIKLAENYQERYAIVGFSNITGNAHMLCDLLSYELDIFTIHDGAEVRPLLEKLKAEGYRMVVCDMISYTEARLLGLNAILISSGAESIDDAFTQAVKISTSQIHARRENRLLRQILGGSEIATVIFTDDGEIYYSSLGLASQESLFDTLRHDLPRIRSGESRKLYRNIEGTVYAITGTRLAEGSEDYVAFQISDSKLPSQVRKHAIHYANKTEAEEQFYNSFYAITGSMGDLEETVKHFRLSPFPVLISGENGTGKEQIARALYLGSPRVANPFITIDCSQMTDKAWTYLTTHFKSPLNDSESTIYFQSINFLSAEQRKGLLSLCLNADLARRNRLIISCVSSADAVIPPEGQEFRKGLSCLTINLPPLRKRILDLPNLSSIYLSTLNVELGKQLSGFEPKAMEMLMQYSWPGNYAQFKRLITELAVLTEAPYIRSHEVASLLDKEQAYSGVVSPGDSACSLDLSRPLDLITRDLIREAVARNQGNQSLTAKQLQISRTTLWRYLKE